MRIALGLILGLVLLLYYSGDLRRARDRWMGPPAVRWIRQGGHWCFHIATRSRRRAIETLLALATPPDLRPRSRPWA